MFETAFWFVLQVSFKCWSTQTDVAIEQSDWGSFDQMVNASDAKLANNAKHLRNNNVLVQKGDLFLRFSRLFSRSCHHRSRATCLQICWQIAVPVWFAFIVKFCGKFCEERMLCAFNFSLWLLLIGFPLDPLFNLISQLFNLHHIFFDNFAENVSAKTGYKLLNYDRSPLFDLIKSFLHSRSLIAYGLVDCGGKNHFYLENCPAFNGSPVTCLRTCLSKEEFQEHVFGNSILSLHVSWFWMISIFLVWSIVNVRFMNQKSRTELILVVCQGVPSIALQPAMAHFPTHLR